MPSDLMNQCYSRRMGCDYKAARTNESRRTHGGKEGSGILG